jgi:hypothetical protein
MNVDHKYCHIGAPDDIFLSPPALYKNCGSNCFKLAAPIGIAGSDQLNWNIEYVQQQNATIEFR